MAQPLVLTLKLDDATFARLDALRRAHYPPERNQVPAHLTLFHALPGERKSLLRPVLEEAARRQRKIPLAFKGVKSLGGGVALTVEAPALSALRRDLADEFAPFLTAQDSAGFRPHVTLQNKVTTAEAETLRRELNIALRPFEGRGEGLILWRYLGGPWQREAVFPFRG
ncbi:2'-5' RNA ligase family protein [Afifella sp. YEN Y35]|uniref:2'-5' RNA ligase family protein n=1 Tax=Afifella sp. YEN Y35 TaxID=3388337 RepID=UPI0039DF87ED